MTWIVILCVADIFHATIGRGHLGQARQAKDAGVFKPPVTTYFGRQVNLSQNVIAQDEFVLGKRLATLGFGMQFEGYRAAIADFQQLQARAVDNTLKPLAIGRVAQPDPVARSIADFGR